MNGLRIFLAAEIVYLCRAGKACTGVSSIEPPGRGVLGIGVLGIGVTGVKIDLAGL